MTQYVLAGLALGSIYAIASAGLVVTYVSAGVLNFAFGSMAYVVARFYFWLNSQHGWPTTTAGAVSILVAGPLLGAFLYLVLFRFIRGQSTLIKLVTTIGLSVALPPVADLLMGTQTITAAPGLALPSDPPFHFLGAPVSTDQLLTYGFLVAVVVLGTVVLRLTDVGLRVRAVVDSEAMASLSGTNPGRVALGAWMLSAMLAGLAGILVAPSNGLTTVGMTTLMAAAFAAVVAARLRSLVGAVVVALAMGVVTDVITKYLPVNSAWTADILPSVPFAVMFVFLVVYAVRARPATDRTDGDDIGGPLDQAIRPANQTPTTLADTVGPSSRRGTLVALLPFAVVFAVPLIFSGNPYWLGVVATGLCFSVIFLTFTVVTGEGGMLWLSQAVMAGIGALAAAQFATVAHWPVLLSLLAGGVIAAVVGAVMGALTIRLGQLYVALGTLTFGLLAETLVFDQNRFLQGGLGVDVARPSFAKGDLAFSYLALIVFALFALLIVNLRRSTSGMALTAVRDSESASRTLGLSVVQLKIIVGALAAFVAAVGGGFLALDGGVAQPASYETFAGLVWLAVVVTLGIRSILAAAIAGLVYTLLPAVFRTYIPTRWLEVPAILFGLGAIMVARNPEGVVVRNGRQLRRLAARLTAGRAGASSSAPAAAAASVAGAQVTAAADRVGAEAGQ